MIDEGSKELSKLLRSAVEYAATKEIKYRLNRMAEELEVSGATRSEKYQSMIPQLASLLGDEADLIANLANIAAVLSENFGFLWVGFYRRVGEELILGPFQGPVACSRISIPDGVCGAAVAKAETIIVPNVDEFSGHIACSSKSKSEIAVPLVQNGEVKLVLDVDSEEFNDFSELDKKSLEQVMKLINEKYPAPNPLLQML